VSTEPFEEALKVVDHVDALLAYWDRDLKCRFANAAYKVWFGRQREEMLGIHMKDLLGPLYELNLPPIEGVLKGDVQVFEREIALPDGSIRHSLASYYPDIVNGTVVGFTVQVANVTRLKQLERELMAAKLQAEQLATHDFLTGLPNRVLLADTISNAIERARRSSRLSGVAVIDFDAFKAINDNYGHETGDAFLKEAAQRMKSAMRGSDTVIRVGGDEFILILCEIETIEDVEIAIKRLIDAVCRPFGCKGTALSPSLSCGVAVFPANGRNAEELLQAADAAMYKAKARGKNALSLPIDIRQDPASLGIEIRVMRRRLLDRRLTPSVRPASGAYSATVVDPVPRPFQSSRLRACPHAHTFQIQQTSPAFLRRDHR
jgi:diguanylate cyclase (GGDEF)-like protein/PAS domain S-box-containing protein